MERCPVCNRELQNAVCPECGFDRSRNYKTNSTRCRISNDVCDGAERRKMPANIFACPECGKNLFHFYPEAGALRCVSCRYLHQIELKKQEKQVTAPQAAPVQTDENCQVFGNTISAGCWHTVSLRRDGTVVAVGSNVFGQCSTDSWIDIVSIFAGCWHTVGLRRDGTVVAVGDNEYGQCNTTSWRDIVSISAGVFHTVGQRCDGTVVAVGDNTSGQCRTDSWRDIVSISAGRFNTVGLRRDGTVVAVGDNENGRCSTDSWRDIVAITASAGYTVGLRRDGTLVATGCNDHGQCNVSDFRAAIPGTPIPW